MAAKNRKRRPLKPTNAQAVTTGTTIRMEEPSSERKPKPSKTMVVVQEMNPADGFTDWLRNHAIVGLSIGFIIGNLMAGFVRILVDNLVDPLTKLFFGTALSNQIFVVNFGKRSATFGWGIVVYNLIIILFVIFILFLAFKFLSLDKLDKPKDEDKK